MPGPGARPDPAAARGQRLARAVAALIGAVFLFASPAGADGLSLVAVKQHVLDGEFDQAEDELARYERRYYAGETDDEPVDFAYRASRSSEPRLERRLGRWITASPDSHRPYLARARYYQELGWLSRGAAFADETSAEQLEGMTEYMAKAQQDLQAALERKPDLTIIYADLIDIAKAYASADAARRIAQRGLAHDQASYAIRSGLLYTLQPKWGGSVAAMREVINRGERFLSETPDLAVLRGYIPYVRGDHLDNAGQPAKAIEQFDKALAFGELAMFYTARADEHEDIGDYDAAEADVRRALEISPQSARVLTHMGNVLSDQDEHEAALAYYDRAIALNPLNPRARMGRGDAYRVLDRWQEAVVDYEKATVYDRDNASLYYFLS